MGDILAAGAIQSTATSSSAKALPEAALPPRCTECNDAGFVRRDVPPGDENFGRAIPCRCARDEARDEQQTRLNRYSNLGPLAGVRFGQLPLGRSVAFAEAARAASAFAEAPQGWLALWGATGRGKTSLAAAIANERIAVGLPALYVVVPDLLDHLRAAYNKDSALPYATLFEQVRNAPLLILDDLDAGNPTEWAREKLFQLLNHRSQSELPTVITTTTPPESLPEWLARRLEAPMVQRLPVDGPEAGAYAQIGGVTREVLERLSFDAFRPDGRGNLPAEQSSNLRTALRMARVYAEQPEGWITFTGETGRGKTHLAAAIARERLRAGDGVYFAIVPDLLDHLRASYNPSSGDGYDALFDRVRNAGLLILDDLGAHSTTPWAEEKLYQIFAYRYVQRLPTVVTTNANLMDRAALPDRIASRLMDTSISAVFAVEAPDFRSGRKPREGTSSTPRKRRW